MQESRRPQPNTARIRPQSNENPEPSRSSPFVPDSYDDTPIIDAYFKWKIERANIKTVKKQLPRLNDIVASQGWSIDELRMMEDNTSPEYRQAVQVGVPASFAKGFRSDLRLFKPEWKESEATSALVGMAGGTSQ